MAGARRDGERAPRDTFAIGAKLYPVIAIGQPDGKWNVERHARNVRERLGAHLLVRDRLPMLEPVFGDHVPFQIASCALRGQMNAHSPRLCIDANDRHRRQALPAACVGDLVKRVRDRGVAVRIDEHSAEDRPQHEVGKPVTLTPYVVVHECNPVRVGKLFQGCARARMPPNP